MSEFVKHHEKHEESNGESYEHVVHNHEHHHKTPEKHHKSTEQLKDEVEQLNPTKSSEILDKLDAPVQAVKLHPPNNELKRIELNHFLTDIRHNLSTTSKSFSKFIHRPFVDGVSEFTGKTIVRPTAILFAGIFMFVGSSVYLYATYHTNARYNIFVAFFLFFGGFVAGIIVELFYNLFFKNN